MSAAAMLAPCTSVPPTADISNENSSVSRQSRPVKSLATCRYVAPSSFTESAWYVLTKEACAVWPATMAPVSPVASVCV